MADLDNPEIVDAELTGGCQCGRVRYRATMRPFNVHYCHCRMCQRAVGNLFAALASVLKDRLEWTKGEPAIFESSTAVDRGFCRDCGTPLFYRATRSTRLSLTIGSFDNPSALRPERHYGIESQLPWLVIDDHLPREPTDPDWSFLKGMVSRQDPACAG